MVYFFNNFFLFDLLRIVYITKMVNNGRVAGISSDYETFAILNFKNIIYPYLVTWNYSIITVFTNLLLKLYVMVSSKRHANNRRLICNYPISNTRIIRYRIITTFSIIIINFYEYHMSNYTFHIRNFDVSKHLSIICESYINVYRAKMYSGCTKYSAGIKRLTQ